MMAATPRQVIFGTGAIGLATLDALRRRGETVRLVNRSGTAPVPDDIEVLGGDASDPAFATAAAQGAQVVYQTLNPPYHQWVGAVPSPPGQRPRGRPGQRGPAGQHGERLHVRPPQRPAPDRDPPLCRPH